MSLANALRFSGQYEEADQLFGELCEARSKKHGPSAESTLVALQSRVENLLDAGQATEAAALASLWNRALASQETQDESMDALSQTALNEALLEAGERQQVVDGFDETLLTQADEVQRHRAQSVWAASQDDTQGLIEAAEWFEAHLAELEDGARPYARRAGRRVVDSLERHGEPHEVAKWRERTEALHNQLQELADGNAEDSGAP